jgi:hypothetical protein
MYIEGHDQLGNPFRVKCTRLLVYDDYGHAVAAVIRYGNGQMYVGHIGESSFDSYLKALGIKNTALVDTLDLQELPPIRD